MVFTPKHLVPTVPKLSVYASIPLIHNTEFYKEITKIVSHYMPAVDLKLIPINPLTIGSLFRQKEKLNPLMTSGVVYMFNCPMCNVGRYVGSTRRLLRVRVDSHKGVSYRTGAKLSNPEFSNIRNHAKFCKSEINYKDFKILGRTKNDHQLTILESLFIKKIVSELNSQTSSTPLYLS